MNTKDAILSRRSIRKFQNKELSPALLRELILLGRLYSSAGNLQPISFAQITKKENLDIVFSALNWAMYLPDFSISEEERPHGYILLLGEEALPAFFEFDAGAAATSIMLAAEEMGLASCCLKIARPQILTDSLPLQGKKPVYAIALGYPAVKSKITEQGESHRYYRDEDGNFIVPKRSTEDVILWADDENL